jgi:ribosomal protein L7Ae-like RNA K-turn-binding protein
MPTGGTATRRVGIGGPEVSRVPAVVLLEVASLGSHTSAVEVRALVTSLQPPVSIVGELRTHPAILLEVDGALVEQLHRLLQPYSDLEIVELRRHFRREHLARERLIELLAEYHRAHRLAIGAAAVERAMQRRKLELLVLATGLDNPYARIIEALTERNGHTGPLLASDLTRDELGQAAGVRRAGCVGLLRGSRRAFL